MLNSENQQRLLVIDDDPEDLLLIRAAARRAHLPIQIQSYRNGEQFLMSLPGLIDEMGSKDRFCNNSLVLLDLNMPVQDGRSCLKSLRQDPELAALPVIIFSTSHARDDILGSYELGANSYICKPDDFSQLEQILREIYRYWLDQSETEGELP